MRQFLLLIILLMGSVPAVQAETFTGSGAYSNPANWSSGSVPGAGDAAIFDGSAAGPVTIDVPATVASITVTATFPYIITQSAAVSTTGPWAMNGGTWDASSQMLTVGGSFTVASSGASFRAGTSSVVLTGSGSLSNPSCPFAALTIAAGSAITLVGDAVVTQLCTVRGTLAFNDWHVLHLRGRGNLLDVTGALNAIYPHRGVVSFEAQSSDPVFIPGGAYGWTQISLSSLGGAPADFEQTGSITAIDSFLTTADTASGSVLWNTNSFNLASSSWLALGDFGSSAGGTTLHAGASQISAPALCWVTTSNDTLYLESSTITTGEWAIWDAGVHVDSGTSTVVVNAGIGPFWTTVPHAFYDLQVNGGCPLYGPIAVAHDLTVVTGGSLSTQNHAVSAGHDLVVQSGGRLIAGSSAINVGSDITIANQDGAFQADTSSVTLTGPGTLSNADQTNAFYQLSLAGPGATVLLGTDCTTTNLGTILAGEVDFHNGAGVTWHIQGSGTAFINHGSIWAGFPNGGFIRYENASSSTPLNVAAGSYGWASLGLVSLGGAQATETLAGDITNIDDFLTTVDTAGGTLHVMTNSHNLTSSSWMSIGDWGAAQGGTTLDCGSSVIKVPGIAWITTANDVINLQTSTWYAALWGGWDSSTLVNPGQSTVVVSGDIGVFWADLPQSFYNLAINAPIDTVTAFGQLQIGNMLSITAGTLDTNGNAVVASGSITVDPSATLNAGSENVELAGIAAQTVTLSASSVIGNLLIDGGSRTVSLPNGATTGTFTVNAGATVRIGSNATVSTNGLTMNGTLSEPITVNSISPGTPWNLVLSPGGSQTISFVSAQDSNAARGQAIDDRASGTDLGRNNNWLFISIPPHFQIGAALSVLSSAPAQTVPGWISAITPASGVSFSVQVDQPALFAVQPTIDGSGTLFYQISSGQTGTAMLTVSASITTGGQTLTSSAQTSTITSTQPSTQSQLTIASVSASSGLVVSARPMLTSPATLTYTLTGTSIVYGSTNIPAGTTLFTIPFAPGSLPASTSGQLTVTLVNAFEAAIGTPAQATFTIPAATHISGGSSGAFTSATSPYWLPYTVTVVGNQVMVTGNGCSAHLSSIGTTSIGADVPLATVGSTAVEIVETSTSGSKAQDLVGQVTWVPTDLGTDGAPPSSMSIRAGDSLLLEATATTPWTTLSVSGPRGTVQLHLGPGSTSPYIFTIPGIYSLVATDADGHSLHNMQVAVVGNPFAAVTGQVAGEIEYQRSFQFTPALPSQVGLLTFAATQDDDLDVADTTISSASITLGLTPHNLPTRLGTPMVGAFLNGSSGPLLGTYPISSFLIERRYATVGVFVTADSTISFAANPLQLMFMRPLVPHLTITFQDDNHSKQIWNTDSLGSNEVPSGTVRDPDSGEMVGILTFANYKFSSASVIATDMNNVQVSDGTAYPAHLVTCSMSTMPTAPPLPSYGSPLHVTLTYGLSLNGAIKATYDEMFFNDKPIVDLNGNLISTQTSSLPTVSAGLNYAIQSVGNGSQWLIFLNNTYLTYSMFNPDRMYATDSLTGITWVALEPTPNYTFPNQNLSFNVPPNYTPITPTANLVLFSPNSTVVKNLETNETLPIGDISAGKEWSDTSQIANPIGNVVIHAKRGQHLGLFPAGGSGYYRFTGTQSTFNTTVLPHTNTVAVNVLPVATVQPIDLSAPAPGPIQFKTTGPLTSGIGYIFSSQATQSLFAPSIPSLSGFQFMNSNQKVAYWSIGSGAASTFNGGFNYGQIPYFLFVAGTALGPLTTQSLDITSDQSSVTATYDQSVVTLVDPQGNHISGSLKPSMTAMYLAISNGGQEAMFPYVQQGTVALVHAGYICPSNTFDLSRVGTFTGEYYGTTSYQVAPFSKDGYYPFSTSADAEANTKLENISQGLGAPDEVSPNIPVIPGHGSIDLARSNLYLNFPVARFDSPRTGPDCELSYNSRDCIPTALGLGWRTNFDMHLGGGLIIDETGRRLLTTRGIEPITGSIVYNRTGDSSTFGSPDQENGWLANEFSRLSRPHGPWFFFDKRGNLVRERTVRGDTIMVSLDANGFPSEAYEADPSGSRLTDARSILLTAAAFGLTGTTPVLTSLNYGLSGSWSFEYDGYHNITSVTSNSSVGSNLTWTVTYDPNLNAGNLITAFGSPAVQENANPVTTIVTTQPAKGATFETVTVTFAAGGQAVYTIPGTQVTFSPAGAPAYSYLIPTAGGITSSLVDSRPTPTITTTWTYQYDLGHEPATIQIDRRLESRSYDKFHQLLSRTISGADNSGVSGVSAPTTPDLSESWTYTTMTDPTGVIPWPSEIELLSTYTQHGITGQFGTGSSDLVTSYAYGTSAGSIGQVVAVIDPCLHTTTFGYSSTGFLSSSTAGGVSIAYVNDAFGRPTKTTYLSSQDVSTAQYMDGAFGMLSMSLTDILGYVTTTTYDSLLRVQTIATSSVDSVSYSYDSLDRTLQTITAGLGVSRTDTITRDAWGRPTDMKSMDGNGRTISDEIVISYAQAPNASGWIATTSRDGTYILDQTTIDAAGRIVSSGGFHAITVSPNSLQAMSTPCQTRRTYDDMGSLLTVIDPDMNVTRMTTDGLGHVTAVSLPGGGVRTTTRNALGWVLAQTDSDQYQQTFQYDACGRQVMSISAAGDVTMRGYDPAGRLVRITPSTSAGETFSYDGDNRIATHTAATGMIQQMAYLPLGSHADLITGTGLADDSDSLSGIITTTLADASHGLPAIQDIVLSDVRHREVRKVTLSQSASGRVSVVEGWSFDHTSDLSSSYQRPNRADRITSASAINGPVTVHQDQWMAIPQTVMTFATTTVPSTEFSGAESTQSPMGLITKPVYDSVSGDLIAITDNHNTGTASLQITSTMVQRNQRGLVLEASDIAQHLSFTSYDGRGRVRTQTPPSGVVTTVYFTNSDLGERVATTTVGSRSTICSYDSGGRLVGTTTGPRVDFTSILDPAGRELMHAAGGSTTTFQFDPQTGLLTQQTMGPQTTTYTYDQRGTILTQVMQGQTQTTMPDALERPSLIIYPDGRQELTTYDNAGDVATAQQRDAHGTPLRTTSATRYPNLGTVTGATIQTAGNSTSESTSIAMGASAPTGQSGLQLHIQEGAKLLVNGSLMTSVLAHVHDLAGREIQLQADSQSPVVTVYNPDDSMQVRGNLTYLYDPVKAWPIGLIANQGMSTSITTTLSYDQGQGTANGDLTTIATPASTEIRGYDPAGQLIRVATLINQVPQGQPSVASYASTGQMQSMTTPLGETTTYVYQNQTGRLRAEQSPSALMTYGLDGLGNRVASSLQTFTNQSFTLPLNGTQNGNQPGGLTAISGTWVVDSQILDATSIDGSTVARADIGSTVPVVASSSVELSGLTQPGTWAGIALSQSGGQLVAQALVTAPGRLAAQISWVPTTGPSQVLAQAATPVLSSSGAVTLQEINLPDGAVNIILTSGEDGSGIATLLLEPNQLPVALAPVSMISLEALTTVNAIGFVPQWQGSVSQVQRTTALLGPGNVLQQTVTQVGEQSPISMSYGYDGFGRETVSGSHARTYDSLDRLVSSNGTNFAYAGSSWMRTESITGPRSTEFVWDGSQMVSSTTNAQTTTYGYLGSRPIFQEASDGTALYHGHDVLNNVSGLIGQISGSFGFQTLYGYDSFGNETQQNATTTFGVGLSGTIYRSVPVGTPLGGGSASDPGLTYKGEWRDASGLTFLRNRYMDPTLGRFTQSDPSGQDANNYAYAAGDPVNKIDPMGTRALIAVDAWDDFSRWWKQNLSIDNGRNDKIGYGFPSGNEGAYATNWGFGASSRFFEASVIGNIDANKLSDKDLGFLSAVLDPNHTYVFDKNGWRDSNSNDAGGWFASFGVNSGKVLDSALAPVGNALAWIGDETASTNDSLTSLAAPGVLPFPVATAGADVALGAERLVAGLSVLRTSSFLVNTEKLEARIANLGARVGGGSGGGGIPSLFWHRDPVTIAKIEREGVLAQPVGAGGKYWATNRQLDELGPLQWRIGGRAIFSSRPPFLTLKPPFNSTYTLTETEQAMFRPATGFGFSWNVAEWWKGLAGQYYYAPNPVSLGQRLGEAAWNAPVVAGFGYLGYEGYQLEQAQSGGR